MDAPLEKNKLAGPDADLIVKIDDQIRREKMRRMRYENIWQTSIHFLGGDQWLRQDTETRRVVREKSQDRARYAVRFTNNAIRGFFDARLAKLTQNAPVFKATPASQDTEDLQAARLGEALLKHVWRISNGQAKFSQAVQWSMIGQGYWEIFWDDTIGGPTDYVENPENGDPYPPDGPIGSELVKSGEPIQTTGAGEIGIRVLSPFELYVFGAKDPQEATSAVKVVGYSKEQVKDRWNVDIEPNGKEFLTEDSLLEKRPKNQTVIVKEVFQPKTDKNPKGHYIVYSGEKILYSGDYPYNISRLPFIKFGGMPNPAKDYDDSYIGNLLAYQREINLIISQISEHKNLTSNPIWMAPKGFGDGRQRMTNEPGLIYEYNVNPILKDGGMPQPIAPPPVPQHMFQILEFIKSEMSDAAGIRDLMTEAPARADSGFAFQLMLEQQNSRLYPYVSANERALSQAGQLVIALAQQFYTDKRVIELTGAAGLPWLKSFTNADLTGISDLIVKNGSTMPDSLAAKGALLMEMYQAGAISEKQLLEHIDSSGIDEINAVWQQDKNRQAIELEHMKGGDQLQQPEPWDDNVAHMEVLSQVIKSPEWFEFSEEQQENIREHYQLHSQAQASTEDRQILQDKLRVALNIQQRGESVDPDVLAQLAGAVGMQIDSEDVAANEDALREAERESRLTLEDTKSENKRKMAETQAMLKAAQEDGRAAGKKDQSILDAQLSDAQSVREFIRELILQEAEKDNKSLKVIPIPMDTNSPLGTAVTPDQQSAQLGAELEGTDGGADLSEADQAVGAIADAEDQEALAAEEAIAAEESAPMPDDEELRRDAVIQLAQDGEDVPLNPDEEQMVIDEAMSRLEEEDAASGINQEEIPGPESLPPPAPPNQPLS